VLPTDKKDGKTCHLIVVLSIRKWPTGRANLLRTVIQHLDAVRPTFRFIRARAKSLSSLYPKSLLLTLTYKILPPKVELWSISWSRMGRHSLVSEPALLRQPCNSLLLSPLQ
jgi:hypothetical protein